jgi:hypothetical protein
MVQAHQNGDFFDYRLLIDRFFKTNALASDLAVPESINGKMDSCKCTRSQTGGTDTIFVYLLRLS